MSKTNRRPNRKRMVPTAAVIYLEEERKSRAGVTHKNYKRYLAVRKTK